MLHSLVNLDAEQQLLGLGLGDKLQDKGHVDVSSGLAQEEGHANAVLMDGVLNEIAQDVVGEVI